MTFNQFEQSRASGDPVELYEFQYGPTTDMVYRYTNNTRDVTFGGKVFEAIPISRAAIKTDGKLDKSNLTITVPVNTDLASLFLDWPPTQSVVVKIRAGHRNDPDDVFMVVFMGRVLSTSRSETETQLTCESALISMKRSTNKRNWQYGCPFALYDNRCQADKQAAKFSVIVEAIDDDGRMTFPAGWYAPREPTDFRGGLIEWDNPDLGREARQIKKVGATQMTIIGIVRGIVVGDTVDIFLGCGRNMDDCNRLHDNILNYGGQPDIPLKNPISQHPWW